MFIMVENKFEYDLMGFSDSNLSKENAFILINLWLIILKKIIIGRLSSLTPSSARFFLNSFFDTSVSTVGNSGSSGLYIPSTGFIGAMI